MTEQELIEQLADKEHAGWAHWQAYLFSVCERASDGSMSIPTALVKRWQRQIDTPYVQLSEREKQSDRNEAAKILPIIRAFVQGQSSTNEDKERLIREVIAWNLDWNRFDHETGEEELVAWVLDTHKRLEGYAPSSLPALLYANSLADQKESEGDHAQA